MKVHFIVINNLIVTVYIAEINVEIALLSQNIQDKIWTHVFKINNVERWDQVGYHAFSEIWWIFDGGIMILFCKVFKLYQILQDLDFSNDKCIF